MLKRAVKLTVRLAVLAALATVAARIIDSMSRPSAPEASPVIGGDTWPPVPVKPAPQE
jgi:hypothetical protein